jgi:hypothetical protein
MLGFDNKHGENGNFPNQVRYIHSANSSSKFSRKDLQLPREIFGITTSHHKIEKS